MKKLLLLLTLFFSLSFFAQNEVKITSKKCISKKGYHLKLVKVFDDSRCPQDVTCIWAGEVLVVVSVYNDKKFIEDKTITFNAKNQEENKLWFSKYYSKKIKFVGFGPARKEGVVTKLKNQFIRISFEN